MKEIELKFELIQEEDFLFENLQSSYKLGVYKLGDAENSYQKVTYFDTPDFLIQKNNGCVRLKTSPEGKEVISIKYIDIHNNTTESYLDRQEIEGLATTDKIREVYELLRKIKIVPKDWDVNNEKLSIEEQIHRWGLKKLFIANKTRIDRTVCIEDEEVAMLSIDHVEYSGNNQTAIFREIEVEQTKGVVSHLNEFSKYLSEKYIGWVKPTKISKYERGLMLLSIND